MKFQPRRCGKSMAAKMLSEAALDSGEVVLFCSMNSVPLLKKRKGRLTLIQEVRPLEHNWISIDELPLGGD